MRQFKVIVQGTLVVRHKRFTQGNIYTEEELDGVDVDKLVKRGTLEEQFPYKKSEFLYVDKHKETRDIKLVAPIPCYGRLPLLRLTVRRLYEKNGVHKVILVGHEKEVEDLAEELGCEFVYHANEPLGAKWNAGFIAAKKYNPDGVLFVGSSDWISDEYINYVKQVIDTHDLIGMLGCYFTDVDKEIRSVHWKGYKVGNRADEPIGIGRVLSSRILDEIDWRPFDMRKNSSLDWDMYQKVIIKDGRIGIFDSKESIKFLSISTPLWDNKHSFNHHWINKIPSERIDSNIIVKEFPELIELKNELCLE